jgi:hypothetical protein
MLMRAFQHRARLIEKSFLVLFYKKELLSSLSCLDDVPMARFAGQAQGC